VVLKGVESMVVYTILIIVHRGQRTAHIPIGSSSFRRPSLAFELRRILKQIIFNTGDEVYLFCRQTTITEKQDKVSVAAIELTYGWHLEVEIADQVHKSWE
jgi:hypothetical protein